MKYFYSLLIVLFFIACTDNAHKNQTTYRFTDQEGQPIKIQTDFNTFDIFSDTPKPQDIEKTTLIMFLDLSSENSKDYILGLNHLTQTFPKAYIIGILTQKYPNTEIDQYIQTNHIHFPILNPTDSKNLLDDFFKKINESDEKVNPTDETQAQQTDTSSKIPFFVLYDKHGKKYQTYTGMIPEEMFAYDIDTLSKKH
ncbi:hypothetical protein [Helicobacter cappadocius]|uniref:Lipoprotein n=1 Tax=Helicobacter cappadocius TaxID=3063998 RepID=A0AA90PQ94_9HELI|nr:MULTISPECIES: hypothetical protein [unclassified Helicobacter]MDO7253153.1 hypothetical protein [Helicobacter sp. faydin-H75]MDP2538721.1 hypothetical protein [Helicobacter sp. faydin-H76]